MTTRSAYQTAGLLIALILLFAALPSQTQDASSLSIDNLQFVVENEKWKLKWASGGVPDRIQVQFVSAEVTDVWASVSASLSVHSASTPYSLAAAMSPIFSNPAGLTVDFRIRAAACSLVDKTE